MATGLSQFGPTAEAVDSGGVEEERIQYRLFRDGWSRFRRNPLGVLGLGYLIALVVAAIIAPALQHFGLLIDPLHQDPLHAYESVSRQHLLGTDYLGRDLLSRVIFGAQISLTVGFLVQFVILMIGGPIGLLAGYFGGWIDDILMRFADMMWAFPDLLWVVVLVAILGPSLFSIFVAIGAIYWVGLARLVRGQVLAIRDNEYVYAAVVSGSPPLKIIAKHVIPNSIAPVIVYLTFGIPQAIFLEAVLSYLGIGISPPTPSWGVMAQEGYQAIFAYPIEVLVPVIAIASTLLACTFLGDAIRDAFDVKATS